MLRLHKAQTSAASQARSNNSACQSGSEDFDIQQRTGSPTIGHAKRKTARWGYVRLSRKQWEWNEEDLLRLVSDGVRESLQLEYKSSASLDFNIDRNRQELAKDVTAFANSAGGTIVYGVNEKDTVPIGLDEGVDQNVVSSERLEGLITANVSPLIRDLRVRQVPLVTSAPGRVAYVVHVPQSTTAHMARPLYRYYRRHNFKAQPMEDYEVRDVMARRTAPDLHLQLAIDGRPLAPGAQWSLGLPGGESAFVRLNARLFNRSITVTEWAYSAIIVTQPIMVSGSLPRDWSVSEGASFMGRKATRLARKHTPTNAMPAWAGLTWELIDAVTLIVPVAHSPTVHAIGWEISAPGMTPRKEVWALSPFNATLLAKPWEGPPYPGNILTD